MAKATAHCTCRKCGEEFEKIMYAGKCRDAESKARWAEGYFDLCPDCEKIEEQEKLEAKEKELELPDLTGSEKQIAWARKIRIEKIREVADYLENEHNTLKRITEAIEAGDERYTSDKLDEVIEEVDILDRCYELLIGQTESRFWIDNRDKYHWNFLKMMRPEATKSDEQKAYEQELEEIEQAKEAEAKTKRCMASPEDLKSSIVVSIRIKDGTVYAINEKSDKLREIYHERQYTWDSVAKAFTHKTDPYRGSAEDHAAELGNILLNAGYQVEFPDAEIMRKAVEADYEPEIFRRIWSNDPGYVCIRWGNKYTFYNNDLYYAARKIGGATKACPDIKVPVKSYKEIEDFAEMYKFIFSPVAQAAIDAYKASVTTVTTAAPKTADTEANISGMRNEETDILARLRDED